MWGDTVPWTHFRPLELYCQYHKGGYEMNEGYKLRVFGKDCGSDTINRGGAIEHRSSDSKEIVH